MIEGQVLEGRQKTRSKVAHTVPHSKNKTTNEMKIEAIIPYTQHIKHFSC
jgi:hypothetical protein